MAERSAPVRVGTPLQDSVAGKTVTGVRVALASNPALAFNAVRSEPAPSPMMRGVKVAVPTLNAQVTKSAPLRVGVPLIDSVAASTVSKPVVYAKDSGSSGSITDVARVTAHVPAVAQHQKVVSPVVQGQGVRCLPAMVGTPIVDSVPGGTVLAPTIARAVKRPEIVVEASEPVIEGKGYCHVEPTFQPQVDVVRSGVVVPQSIVTGGHPRVEVDTRSPVVIPVPVVHGPTVELGVPVVDAFSDSPVTVPGVTLDVVLEKPGYAYHQDRAPIQRRRRRRKKV